MQGYTQVTDISNQTLFQPRRLSLLKSRGGVSDQSFQVRLYFMQWSQQQSLFFSLSLLTKFSFRPKCQSPLNSTRPSLFGVPGSTDREPWIQPGFICNQGSPVYEEGGLFIVQLPIHFIGFLYKTISKNGILLLKMVFLLSRMTLVFSLS